MYCNYVCGSYNKIEAKSTIIYKNQIKIDENRFLEIFVNKYNKGFGNNLFAINIIELYKQSPIFKEILVINREKSVFNGDKISKCICNGEESIRYDKSRFFSIDELGRYRNKTLFRDLYNTLDNFNPKTDRGRLEALIFYILRDNIKPDIEQQI